MTKKPKANKKKRKQSDKARIRELTKENARLKRELVSLKDEMERGRSSARRLFSKRDSVRSALSHQARRQETYAQENFLFFLFKALKNTSFFRIYVDIVNTVRQLTFVTTTIQVIIFLLAIVESSAILVISTSAFIVAMPFMLIVSALGTALSIIGSRKATKVNRPLVKNKDVYVFLPAKKSAIREGSYFVGFVKEIAHADSDRVCIIVAQGFFFSRGIGKRRRYYFTSRKEEDNIIIVRRHYYYKLKNKILIPEANSISEIY